jgi:hypothetical protein
MQDRVDFEAVHRNAAAEYEKMAREAEARGTPGSAVIASTYRMLAATRLEAAAEAKALKDAERAHEWEPC